MMNGNGQAEQKQAYDGRTEVAVSLPVNVWNEILTVIADAPWRKADPLMTEIRRQITAKLDPPHLDTSGPQANA